MSNIVNMHGQPMRAKERPITKAQAGAILTSELDLAIQTWNTNATQQANGDASKAHLFILEFNRFEYAPEAKEKSGLFGYAKLSLSMKYDGKLTEVYDKGQNFKKAQELDNTNGYYPSMVIDCLGFLIASGLMYNLAITQEKKVKQPKHATKVNKPGTGPEGEPGNGDPAGNSN